MLLSHSLPHLAAGAFLFMEGAWVPSLKPFFALLNTCFKYLILPVPWVFLLLALTDQLSTCHKHNNHDLHLLFLVPTPWPLEAHRFFCLCQLCLPFILLRVWVWLLRPPMDAVPLVYTTRGDEVT